MTRHTTPRVMRVAENVAPPMPPQRQRSNPKMAGDQMPRLNPCSRRSAVKITSEVARTLGYTRPWPSSLGCAISSLSSPGASSSLLRAAFGTGCADVSGISTFGGVCFFDSLPRLSPFDSGVARGSGASASVVTSARAREVASGNASPRNFPKDFAR
eukprot:scaffold2389_cov262-Pinguiococcus_pyrenoidosus.AAC.6